MAAPELPPVVELTADPWPPFNGDSDGEHPGYMVELARQLSKPLGVEVRYVPRPWPRAINEVSTGHASCLIAATPVEAPQFSFPRYPWFNSVYIAYVRADDPWQFRAAAPFDGRTVGLVAGYDYGEPLASLQQTAPNGRFHLEYGDQPLVANLRLLLHHSLDVVVENEAVMDFRLKQMGLTSQVKRAGAVGEGTPLYLACTPGDQRLINWLAAVDVNFEQALADGRVAALRSYYGLATAAPAEAP